MATSSVAPKIGTGELRRGAGVEKLGTVELSLQRVTFDQTDGSDTRPSAKRRQSRCLACFGQQLPAFTDRRPSAVHDERFDSEILQDEPHARGFRHAPVVIGDRGHGFGHTQIGNRTFPVRGVLEGSLACLRGCFPELDGHTDGTRRVVGLECLGIAHIEQAKGGEQRKFVGLDHWIAWCKLIRRIAEGRVACSGS